MFNPDVIARLNSLRDADGSVVLGDDRPAWKPGEETAGIADRLVSAEDLREYLLGAAETGPVYVAGAVVVGSLSLDYQSTAFPLGFVDCVFDSGLSAIQANLPSLFIMACKIHSADGEPSMAFDRITLQGNLNLAETHTFGAVSVAGAKIGGQWIFPGLRIAGRNENDVSLFASGATVADSLWAQEGLICSARTDFSRLRVSGDMHITGARFNTAAVVGASLSAYGMHIEGSLHADAIRANGEVVFGGIVAGDLSLIRVKVESKDTSIRGRDLHVGGIVLVYRCNLEGDVELGRCHFDNELIFAKSIVRQGSESGGTAVDLRAATIRGTLRIEDGWRSGTADISEARIGGSVSVVGSKVAASSRQGGEQAGASLLAHRAVVDGDVNVGLGSEFGGHLMFMSARIAGSLFVSDAKVSGVNGLGASVILDRAAIGGSIRVERTAIRGAFRTPSVRVGNQYRINIEVESPDVDGSIVACHGASVEGRGRMYIRSRASGASIDIGGSTWSRGLHVFTTQSVGPDREATDLTSSLVDLGDYGLVAGDAGSSEMKMAKVAGALVALDAQEVSVTGEALFGFHLELPDQWSAAAFECEPFQIAFRNAAVSGRFAPIGFPVSMDLTGCDVGSLELPDDLGAFPALTAAEGWRVGALSGLTTNDRRIMSRWLRRYFHSGQTWYEVASVFEQRGALADGRRLRYEAAVQRSKQDPLLRQLLGIAARAVTGYGYYPLRSLVALLAVCGIAAGLCDVQRESFETPLTAVIATAEYGPKAQSSHDGLISADRCSKAWDVACFDPAGYALESTIPGSAGGQGHWRPADAWLSYVLALLRMAAWVLAALFIAGATGLLRKKE